MVHLRKDASGHLIKGTDGHLVNNCVTNVGIPCTPCPEDPTPEIVDVVFSGVTMTDACCACVYNGPDPDGTHWDPTPAALDGAYQLTQQTGGVYANCFWLYEQAVTGTFKIWEDDITCSGAPDYTTVVVKLRIELYTTFPDKAIWAAYCVADPTGCSIRIMAYYDQTTIDSVCFDWVSTNECTCENGCVGHSCSGGAGGTATVSYVP